MTRRFVFSLLGLALLGGASSAQVTAQRIASGIVRPLWAGAPDGDPRIFIALKGGQIRVLKQGALLTTPFLDLAGRVSTGSEQGLLGVAFHPDYANNGFFFVNYTDTAGDTVISRYHVSPDPDLADSSSESVILTQDQPFTNHNGGDLHFGPDGYLYCFFGDGGSQNDPGCRAQNLGLILGKILRIDVDSASPYAIPPDNPFVGQAGVREEIFHYGLRNPWRSSFDRLTGDLYVGDVGQDAREEIDFLPFGTSGRNLGWKMMEGTRCNSTTNCQTGLPLCNDSVLVQPITELTHAAGSFAITGGYVYRGCLCPGEYGKYFYADYVDNKIRSLEYDTATGTVSNLTDRTAELAPGGGITIRNIASFGEDGFGELLILDEGGAGEVFKMVPAGAVQATNVVRNGSGVNRLCLSGSSLAILGNSWEAQVDTAGHPGATFAFLVGYKLPQSGTFLPGGERLYNPASLRYFRIVQASNGTTDVFRAAIPCKANLAGLTIYIQAGILGGAGIELCNALDTTAGYY